MWIMGLHKEFMDAIPIIANMTFELSQVSQCIFSDQGSIVKLVHADQLCAIF